MPVLIFCGCGKHHIQQKSRNNVMWKGEAWDARCAFEDIKKSLSDRDDGRLCDVCGQEVDRGCEVVGDKVYHIRCISDLGGG